jgi:predicted solute-binding protein
MKGRLGYESAFPFWGDIVKKTKIGIPSNLYCRPLVMAMQNAITLELDIAAVHDLARKLRQGDLHAGFVSPIEYARESSEYRILPALAVSSHAGVGVYCRKGLRDISTLAADPSLVSEIVLARIVFAEEFERIPAIVPMVGSLEKMLARADSALVAGDAFPHTLKSNPDCIDLAELWSEMVGLPFVHGFLAAREGGIDRESVQEIISLPTGREIEQWRDHELPFDAQSTLRPDELSRYLDMFTYEMNEEAEGGLAEFLRYAHYHGVLADIPDFRFYPESTSEGDEFDQSLSLN